MQGNPLHTRLCEEYGCELPIVAFAHTKDVIAAVTNAGGIGILGGAGQSPDELRSNIRWIKERVGDKPFGVDLLVPASFVEGNREDLEEMIPQGYRDFVEQLHSDNDIPHPKAAKEASTGSPNLIREAREALDIIFEERVPIFASGLGSPAFIIEEAHAVGTKIWGLIGLPRQARRQVEAGVDVIIDDTPGVVIVSAFDPVRREVARQSLIKLIADGRIHPSRIEEIVAETSTEID